MGGRFGERYFDRILFHTHISKSAGTPIVAAGPRRPRVPRPDNIKARSKMVHRLVKLLDRARFATVQAERRRSACVESRSW